MDGSSPLLLWRSIPNPVPCGCRQLLPAVGGMGWGPSIRGPCLQLPLPPQLSEMLISLRNVTAP